MKSNKNVPGLVVLIILTLITVFCWIGLSIYRALTTKPPVEVSEAVLAPLDPTLNQEYLDRLPQRGYIENLATGTTQITILEELASPTPSATPIASESASASATPQASASATPSTP